MQNRYKKVSVIGLGYIGLPTAAVLASRGVEVIGVDINPVAVETINDGKIHIVEPGLDVVVRGAVQAGKLRATSKPEPAEVFLVAVPTPFKENYEPDLSYVEAAARALAPVLKKGDLVILESTSPVGTTEQVCQWLQECRPDLQLPCGAESDAAESYAKIDVHVAYCPERVLPGKVIHELTENDRVIGGMTAQCAAMAVDLYKIFVNGQCITTNAKTAEMVKLTENAYRDVNIAFANEVSIICEKLDINPWELISLANRHPRVSILNPGPGVGGHCISIDPWFIVSKTPEEARLIRTSREVNDSKPHFIVDKVKKLVSEKNLKSIACLGLAFKANIDDLRESPAMEIVESLARDLDCQMLVSEPYVCDMPSSLREFNNVQMVRTDSAMKEADLILLLVDHDEFKKADRELLSGKLVVDTRGIWS